MKSKLTSALIFTLGFLLLSALPAAISHAQGFEAAENYSVGCDGFKIGINLAPEISVPADIDFQFQLERTNPPGPAVSVIGTLTQTQDQQSTSFSWGDFPGIPWVLPDGTLAAGDYDIPTVDVPGFGRTAGTVNLAGSATTFPLHFSEQPLTCEGGVGSCRMTGGNATVSPAFGEDGLETWTYDFKSLGSEYWITTGGQIGAPSGGIPRGHWTHTQHGGAEGNFTFHSGTSSAPDGTEISTIECADPGWCVQARCAPFKQIFWTGVGNFAQQHFDGVFPGYDVVAGGPKKGGTLHFYRAMVGDFGENDRPTREIPGNCDWLPPGPYDAAEAVFLNNSGPDPQFGDKGGQICDTCPDYYQIAIHATKYPDSDVIYEFYGFLENGNYQIHPQTGEQCPATPELVPELFNTKGKGIGRN